MAQTIPISQVVTINPGVLGTGGNPLAVNGVFVTTSEIVPVGSLLSFASADDVADYFGTTSAEAGMANKYFLSFDNSQKKPSEMIFGAFAGTARPAWVRGSSVARVSMTTLKSVTGNFSITINGTVKSATNIDLSQCATQSEIATALAQAINLGSDATCTWDALASRFMIKNEAAGDASTISEATGSVAVGLGLASGTISQGTAGSAPSEAMDMIKSLSLNWGTFTVVEAIDNSTKQQFAEWTNNQNRRYLFVCWDNDPNIKTQPAEGRTATFGEVCEQMKWEAVLPVFDSVSIASFVMGAFASIDWEAVEGRIDTAFKSQSGLAPSVSDLQTAQNVLAPSVSDLQTAQNVLANGYSYYGAYAASGQGNTFNFFYNGQLPGSEYGFADTFVNQIFLNSQLQLAIATLLMSVRSLPYNSDGYSKLRLACSDPIQQALNNGTIRRGVALSQTQKAMVISAVGQDVSTELFSQGYFLYIGEATAQVRGQRVSPPMTLLYMDGGSIQKVELGSVVVR